MLNLNFKYLIFSFLLILHINLNSCNKKYGYSDDENPIIYFNDAYDENFKLEALLKQYQRGNRLRFPAIIFMIKAFKLTKCQIKALNDQDNKSCFVFVLGIKLIF
jgi:hypothetical protein